MTHINIYAYIYCQILVYWIYIKKCQTAKNEIGALDVSFCCLLPECKETYLLLVQENLHLEMIDIMI